MSAEGRPDAYVSTGTLPSRAQVEALVADAHERFAPVDDGSLSRTYPALGAVDPARFGLSVCAADGSVVEAGDAREPFTIMSVAKPFVLALVAEAVGVERVRDLVGVNATGLPFDSVAAVEREPAGRTNPMVNAGAIATTSLVPEGPVELRWRWLQQGLSRFAGHDLGLASDVLASALATNHRNRSIAALLQSRGALGGEAADAVLLYTRQSCLEVTAVDLAVMGATLADGGVQPVTGERVVSAAVARTTLAVMAVAGLYETSGDWLVDVGVPGKSGIGGGIVVVAPGKGALGTYAPLLDGAGNSVRGQLAAAHLARGLGLDVLASQPWTPRPRPPS